MEGDGPVTRSLIRSPLLDAFGEGSTSGFICDNPAHWAIEAFIPIQPDQWPQFLIDRGELKGEDIGESRFKQAASEIQQLAQRQAASWQCSFAAAYRAIDPDRDTKRLIPNTNLEDTPPNNTSHADEAEKKEAVQSECLRQEIDSVIDLMHPMLEQAGYKQLSQEQIEQCVGVASQWGVPLHVDFKLFEQLVVYSRGDIIGTRFKRRLRKFYRRESVEVPIYQRMVVMFQLRQDQDAGEILNASSLHLRMFKNIPQQDVDMLLPCTKVKISGIDRVKIVLPSLGGFLMSIRKIASYALLFAVLALHWTAILTVLIVGYLAKSFLSYFQTKNRYQLNLNRNLYFQKLDTGAGVGFHLASQAASQQQVESTLAYYAIATHDEPISDRKLRRKCERIVREAIEIEIDFQVEPALAVLAELKLVFEGESGWEVTSPIGPVNQQADARV